MTYEEILRAYLAAGGQPFQPGYYSPTGEGGGYEYVPGGSPQVYSGDLSMAYNPQGQLVTAQRQGDQQEVRTFNPDGSGGDPQMMGYNDDAWKRSLAGALAVGVGGPVLGGLASSYLAGTGGLTAAELAAIGGSETAANAGNAALAAQAGGGAMGVSGPLDFAYAGGSPGFDPAAGTGPPTLATNPAATTPAPAGTPPASPPVAGGLPGSLGGLLSNPAAIGAGLGAISGAAGSRPQTQTQTQQSDLPEWMRPYAQSFLSRADNLSQRPFEPYTGEGVAPINSYQQTAIDQANFLAQRGDPLVGRARDQQSALLAGQMLGPNQYLDQYAQGIAGRMSDAYSTGTRARFGGGAAMAGNNLGSSTAFQQGLGMQDRAFADALGQTMRGLYYGNFRDERNAQDAAARNSLGFSADQRANTEGLVNAGGLLQQQQQNVNNYARGEFDRRLQYPQQQLGILGGAINPAFGGTQMSSATQPRTNPWQAAVGGAMSGWALGGMFGTRPQTQGPTMTQANYWNQPGLGGVSPSSWEQDYAGMRR